MKVNIKTAQAILRDSGFEKVYSRTFMYERTNEATEAIYCQPLMGAVLYVVSVGGVVEKARMLLEVKAGMNFEYAQFSECVYFDTYPYVHVAYDMLSVLEKGSKAACLQLLGNIKAKLQPSRSWNILPTAFFADFTHTAEENEENLWLKVKKANPIIKNIWRKG